MSMRLEGWAREVLERPRRFAVLATITRDGAPRQAVVWYALRGDAIVVNSRPERGWPRDLTRDPRFSLLVEEGYEWVSVRGRAERLTDPGQAQADIAEMARRYHADDPARAERAIAGFRGQERVSFLLHAERVTERPDA
jgi:PPOX class probable F420-dependent enzyme